MEVSHFVEVDFYEKNLHFIIDNMPGGLCVFSLIDDYPYIDVTVWNRFMEKITGYSREKINEIGLPNIIDIGKECDNKINAYAYVSEIFKEDHNKEKLLKITDRTGIKRILSFRISKTNTETNKENIIALVTELTEASYSEQEVLEIKEKEAMLRQVAENTVDMIGLYNPDLTKKYLTPSYENVLGYPVEKLINAKLIELFHPEDKNNVLAFINKLNKGVETAKVQYRVICADGTWKYLETYGKCFYKNDLLEGYIFSSRDVTERVKIEEALIKNKKRFMTLFNNVNDAIYLNKLDENGIPSRYVEVNDVACERLGYTREELTSMTIYDTTPYLTVEKVSHLIDVLSTKGNVIYENFPTTKAGRIIPVETNSIFLILDNEKYVLSISRDISERKRREKAAEYERLRTEFFANISHELRTPINVIFSALQVINLDIQNSTSPYKKYVPIMKQNCYRLIRLINNLIDETKIDDGYFQLYLSNVDIVNLVENITLSVAHYIENKNISLIFDTDVEEKIIACDTDKIERIVLNLISNAVKYTKPGGSIFVKIINEDENVIISVKDTGIGISKENQNIIFDRFVQVDKSIARNREGSGIGLSLVKALVKMHNGTICVESELNKGSEFIVAIPVYLIENSNENLNTNDYNIQDNVEKINIELSDIYFY